MNLPIFHGQHSNNTQIQMKRMCYLEMWQSITQRESNDREKWALPAGSGEDDLLAVLSELHSSQQSVVLPNNVASLTTIQICSPG